MPSTRDKSIKLHTKAFESRVKQIGDWLASIFQGATIDYAIGDYKYKNKIIGEEVAIISVFTTQKLYNYYDLQLKDMIKAKKKSWGQDSMAFEYKNKMVFI